jgi:hypothetical protein
VTVAHAREHEPDRVPGEGERCPAPRGDTQPIGLEGEAPRLEPVGVGGNCFLEREGGQAALF